MQGPASIDTLAIHAGQPRPGIEGAVVTPIFQSANYEYDGPGSPGDVRYIRASNSPNHVQLAARIAALEGTEDAIVAASGMAAVSAALLSVLRAGDHVLLHEGVYGGAHTFVTQELPRFGIEHSFVSLDDPESWRSHLRPNTRAVYAEPITNPLMRVPDLHAIAAFAREHGLVSIIDNTFASPVNLRPAHLVGGGFDLVVHSATKYLNGHSDIVAGAVAGPKRLVDAVRARIIHIGASMDPNQCFLLERGIKTLALRMRQHNAGAQQIAEFLESHPGVGRVNYPGLPSHPDHERAKRLLGGFSGMISFELADTEAVQSLFDRLRIILTATSLGGVESLIARPCRTSHAAMPPEERRRLGISDTLVRLSVGVEEPVDLIGDLDHALAAVASAQA